MEVPDRLVDDALRALRWSRAFVEAYRPNETTLDGPHDVLVTEVLDELIAELSRCQTDAA